MAVAKINSLFMATALAGGMMCSVANGAEINTNIARMQAMDKITGMVRVIDLPVNSEVKYGSFSIVVRSCKTRPPEETPENFAFVDVVDNYKSENPINIFRGWMISSSPSLNPVEHPIYDIWLLSCENDKVDPNIKIMNEEELKAREQIPQRTVKSEQVIVEEIPSDNTKAKTNETEPKIVGEALEVEAVKNEELIKSVDTDVVSNVVETVPVADITAERVDDEDTENGPKTLINIEAPVPPMQIHVEEKTLEETISTPEMIDNNSNIDAMVVITAPEVEEVAPKKDEVAPLILEQEPVPVQVDDVVVDEAINTEEIEENGMLDEQLIDFSE